MEMHQFDDVLTKRFFVRVTFCGVSGESVDLARLRAEFARIADAEQMQWSIHDGARRSRVGCRVRIPASSVGLTAATAC